VGDEAAPLVYRFRARPGESVRIEVGSDWLLVRNSRRGDRAIAYGDIKTIRLFSTLPGVYVCAIHPRRGRRVLVANRSSDGEPSVEPSFRYRNDEYVAFVKRLLAATAPYDAISFRAGMPVVHVVMVASLVLLALGGIALLAVVAFALATGRHLSIAKVAPAAGGIAGLLGVLPAAINIARRGGGGAFDPAAVPPDQLPAPAERAEDPSGR
jgi:hypothetical protein